MKRAKITKPTELTIDPFIREMFPEDGSINLVDLVESLYGDLEKAKKANPGEVRTRKDGDWKKLASGKWKKVSKGRPGKKRSEKLTVELAASHILDKTDNKYEVAIVHDADGNILLNKSGEEHSVNFTPQECVKLLGAKTMVHNHPNGWGLSKADIALVFALNIDTMWATSRDRTFSFSPDMTEINKLYKDRFRKNVSWDEGKANQAVASMVHKATVVINDQIFNERYPLVQSGELSIEEADADHACELMRRFVDIFGGEYKEYHWEGDQLAETLNKSYDQPSMPQGIITNATEWRSRKLQGKYSFQGLPLSIENDRGTYRQGKDSKGKQWRSFMHCIYGYVRATEGTDGDHVDVYIGPDPHSERVFIIHQNDPYTGRYDEDKCMLGFHTGAEAKVAYIRQYDRPDYFGSMTEVDTATFKTMLKEKRGMKLKKSKSDPAIIVDHLEGHGLYVKGITHVAINPKELVMGIKVEMEHTNKPTVSRQIALDHLVEDKDYYTYLAEMEEENKGNTPKKLKKSDDEDGFVIDRQKDEEDDDEDEGSERDQAFKRERKNEEIADARKSLMLPSELLKSKRMSIGTISHGREKVAEGKWVPVKKERQKAEVKESKVKQIGKATHADTIRILKEYKRRAPGQGIEKAIRDEKDLDIIIKETAFCMISAGRNKERSEDKNLTDAQIVKRHTNLLKDLKAKGYVFTQCDGKYGDPEESIMVMTHDADHDDMLELGNKYNQDSVLFCDRTHNEMIFTSGDNKGKPDVTGDGFDYVPDADDFYTKMPLSNGHNLKFSMVLNFGKALQFLKAKFIKKWRDKDGNWQYDYGKKGKKKSSKKKETPVRDSAKKLSPGTYWYKGLTVLSKRGKWYLHREGKAVGNTKGYGSKALAMMGAGRVKVDPDNPKPVSPVIQPMKVKSPTQIKKESLTKKKSIAIKASKTAIMNAYFEAADKISHDKKPNKLERVVKLKKETIEAIGSKAEFAKFYLRYAEFDKLTKALLIQIEKLEK